MVNVDEDEGDAGGKRWPQCQLPLDDGFEM